MPIRVTLPSVRRFHRLAGIALIRPVHVQRSCGHTDELLYPMTPGLFRAIAEDRRKVCDSCRHILDLAREANEHPVFRLVSAYSLWIVERKLYDWRGVAAFYGVAFAESYVAARDWIAEHFSGMEYTIERGDPVWNS